MTIQAYEVTGVQYIEVGKWEGLAADHTTSVRWIIVCVMVSYV